MKHIDKTNRVEFVHHQQSPSELTDLWAGIEDIHNKLEPEFKFREGDVVFCANSRDVCIVSGTGISYRPAGHNPRPEIHYYKQVRGILDIKFYANLCIGNPERDSRYVMQDEGTLEKVQVIHNV